MRTLLMTTAALFAVSSGGAMAQDDAAATAARALLLPMLQETAPGKAGEVLTDCVIASATPEEVAAFAAATGPSMEIGASITEILTRPSATTCMTAATE
jgi:hypothetical protein